LFFSEDLEGLLDLLLSGALSFNGYGLDNSEALPLGMLLMLAQELSLPFLVRHTQPLYGKCDDINVFPLWSGTESSWDATIHVFFDSDTNHVAFKLDVSQKAIRPASATIRDC